MLFCFVCCWIVGCVGCVMVAYLVLRVFGAGVGIVALIASRCVLPYEWMLLIYILVVLL